FIMDVVILGQVQFVRVFNAARHLQAGAEAARAPAVFGVVREQAWVWLGETRAAARAGALGREGYRLGAEAAEDRHLDHTLAVFERSLQQFAQACLFFGLHRQRANRQVDGVLFVAVEPRPLGGRQVFAVHAQLFETLSTRPFGEIGV